MEKEFKKILESKTLNALPFADGRQKVLNEKITAKENNDKSSNIDNTDDNCIEIATNISDIHMFVDMFVNKQEDLATTDEYLHLSMSTGITASTWMLWDAIMLHWTDGKQNQTRIEIPLKEYLKMRGLRDCADTRHQIARDLKIIQSINFNYIDSNQEIFIYFGGGYGKVEKGGKIVFDLGRKFCEIMREEKTLDYNTNALKFNQRRNPHSYYLQRYIDINYRRNSTKDPDSKKRIKIKTLLKHLPEMPKLDAVGRKTKQLIVEPLFRDLYALRLNWHIEDKKGNAFDGIPKIKFDDLLEAYLVVKYDGYPSREKCAQAYNQHQKKKKRGTQGRK